MQNAALTAILLLIAACAFTGCLYTLAKRHGARTQPLRMARLLQGIGLLCITIGLSQFAMVLQIAGHTSAAVWALVALCSALIVAGVVLLVIGLSQPPDLDKSAPSI